MDKPHHYSYLNKLFNQKLVDMYDHKSLKYVISLLLLINFGIITNAQTISSLLNAGSRKDQDAAFISAFNPWVGSQVGYMLGDSKEFSDNLIVSGRIMNQIDTGIKNFSLPVSGNISPLIRDVSGFTNNKDKLDSQIKDIILSNQGLNVGLYPYYMLKNADFFYFIAHAITSYKLNGFKDDNGTVIYLNQGRFGGGLEIGLGKTGKDRNRLTLSLTPVFTILDSEKYNQIFKEKRSSITTLELTSAVPLGKGFGLMIENIFPLSGGINTFRAGLVIAVETGN